MKFAEIAAILAFLAVGQAAFLAGPHKASLVAHDKKDEKKEMPTVSHQKTAGDDYEQGSPLYDKQEQRKSSGVVSDTSKPQGATKPDNQDPFLITTLPPGVPASEHVKHWWNSHDPNDEGFWRRGLYFFFSYFINTVLCAVIWMKCLHPAKLLPYWKDSHNERQNMASKEFASMGFAYGLFSTTHCCGHHFSLCCCAYFCTPLRLADTYSKGPEPLIKGGFVVSLLIVTCLIGLAELTAGWSLVVFGFFAIYMRHQIRMKYGMNHDGGSICADCLSWYCCPCCTVVQEARQLDFVYPIDPAQSGKF